MKRGKYQSRRRRINWTGVIFWLVVLTVFIGGIVFLFRSCDGRDVKPEEVPQTSSTKPVTQTTTEADPILTTTEPTTEPVTEPTTEPETEPPTEPETEPTAEPETEPETEPVTEPTTIPEEDYATEYDSQLGQSIVALAQAALGKPYFHGGAGPEAFDTTGFVSYCFRECGVSAPRSLAAQYQYGAPVKQESLQPGDVVFFSLETPGEAEYVGIYIGEDTFIAVSSTKNAVMERKLSASYYAERYLGARRYGS